MFTKKSARQHLTQLIKLERLHTLLEAFGWGMRLKSSCWKPIGAHALHKTRYISRFLLPEWYGIILGLYILLNLLKQEIEKTERLFKLPKRSVFLDRH